MLALGIFHLLPAQLGQFYRALARQLHIVDRLFQVRLICQKVNTRRLHAKAGVQVFALRFDHFNGHANILLVAGVDQPPIFQRLRKLFRAHAGVVDQLPELAHVLLQRFLFVEHLANAVPASV